MTIGNVTTVRWLNTAVTLCRIYLSKHGLRGMDAKNLKTIIEFIIGYYFPLYFFIKVRGILSLKTSLEVVSYKSLFRTLSDLHHYSLQTGRVRRIDVLCFSAFFLLYCLFSL